MSVTRYARYLPQQRRYAKRKCMKTYVRVATRARLLRPAAFTVQFIMPPPSPTDTPRRARRRARCAQTGGKGACCRDARVAICRLPPRLYFDAAFFVSVSRRFDYCFSPFHVASMPLSMTPFTAITSTISRLLITAVPARKKVDFEWQKDIDTLSYARSLTQCPQSSPGTH